MKKNIFNILIISVSLVFIILLIINQGIESFFKQIYGLNPLWIILGFACMLLYWSLEALSLDIITRFHGVKKRFRESFSVTMIGQFFNAVTPFASGGQPAQVLYLIKSGVEAANASSIIMLKFFVFQTVLTVYSLVVIIFSFSYFSPKVPLLLTFTILGLSVHASMIFLTILFSYNRKLTDKIVKFVVKILKKIRFIKMSEDAEKKLEDTLASFHNNASLLKNNLGLLFKSSFVVFMQLAFYFSVSYCIYKSFGLKGTSFFELFAASVYVSTVISIVPLPGSIGGAELGYNSFFGAFFGGGPVVSALLIWRITTFYFSIGFGSIFSVALPNRKKRLLKSS